MVTSPEIFRISPKAGERFSHILPLLAGLLLAVLPGCGNLFNGVGGNGTGTLEAAKATALQDIADGNYAAAASVMSAYCPGNTCPDATSASILADAYIALGSAPNSSYNAASGILVSSPSGGYVGTNQIIGNLISASSSTSSANQTFQAIAQAVPCIENNNCTQNGLSTLLTSIEVLTNSGCNVTSCSSDLASMEVLASAVYILANIQYQTGITYTGSGWEQCGTSGSGTTSCSSVISTSGFQLSSTDLANDCILLYNSLTPLSDCGSPSATILQSASLVSVMGTLTSSLGSNAANVTNSVNEFLNSIIGCSASPCSPSATTSTPSSLGSMNFQNNIQNYLTSIATM